MDTFTRQPAAFLVSNSGFGGLLSAIRYDVTEMPCIRVDAIKRRSYTSSQADATRVIPHGRAD